VAIRSFAGVILFVSALLLAAGGCGRSWLDDTDGTDSGLPDGGPHDSGPDADSSACGASTCPAGCCTPAGVCIGGSTVNACGIGGQICVD